MSQRGAQSPDTGRCVYLPSASCPECGERAVFAIIAPSAPVLLCIDCRLLGRLMDLDGKGG
jgi:hypothetical protein